MIRNFTAAEWSALTEAVALLEASFEDDELHGQSRQRARATLDSAYEKARQLAP